MCKKNLQFLKMTDASATYRDLVSREMRGPSDGEGAMRRLQTKFGIDYWQGWALRYRPPKKIAGELIARVEMALAVTLEQSVKRDLASLKIINARGQSDADFESLTAQAENLLAEIAALKIAKGIK